MKQQILSLIEALPPAVLWTILILSITATGLWRVYKLHPNWASTRHKIATEIFDRLCSAYDGYRAKDDGSVDHPRAEVLRFEGALRDYCKAPVHHRVGDMALRAEYPILALDDLRKLSKGIEFEDGEFKQRLKPYSFPSENAYRKWKFAALVLYLISALALGGPVIAASMGYLSGGEAVLASISLGYLPVMAFVECVRYWKRTERLYRMSVVIKKNGGRLYGEE